MPILSTIPFAGFYGGAHDYEFDRVLESEFEYFAEETGHNMPESLVYRLQDSVNWQAAQDLYAADYAASFLDWLGLDGKFESMSSPREYNFETDRLFVNLTRSDVARLWRMADKEILTRLAKERFTSRSGFISHYSPDWKSWGTLSEWDHNQIGTLVLAAAETEQGSEWSFSDECSLMEDAYCNGDLDNWLCESSPAYVKAANLSYYMRERTKRPPCTLRQWYQRNQKPVETLPLFAHAAMPGMHTGM